MKLDNHDLLLYAVTDRSWIGEKCLSEQVKEALEGGVTCVQLREKTLSKEAFIEEGKKIKALTDLHRIPFVINDEVEVALAIDADGVHVGQKDMAAGGVRERIGRDKILGVSVCTVEQALLAQAHGADYLGVGTIFTTSTKLDAEHVSIETLQSICEAVEIPVVAIGGITKENLHELQGTKIAGIAVVSAIFASQNIKGATRALREQVEKLLMGKGGE